MTSDAPVTFHKHCVTGVLHVHTTRSDGRGEPEEIAEAGLNAGLDYIAFNDHRHLALMDEGWHGKKTGQLMTIVGSELQHTDLKNHLLVYGVDRVNSGGHILTQLADVVEQGGIAVIAHPSEKRPHIPGLGEYPWSFGTGHPVSGVEGWNWMSMWKRRVNPLNVWKRMRFPDLRVINPDRNAVRMWFDTGGCLVGGADAHGHRILGNDVFNYRMLFERIRTHLLLDEPFTSPNQFTEALRCGSCFISNAIAGDASGYRSAVKDGKLYLKLPGAGEVILRGHEPRALEEGVHCLGKTELPLYIEIHRNGRTWIAQGIR
jgi:hypothetical protein